MLTPVDIQNKEFAKGFSGYSKSAVDEFMTEVSAEFERLYRENIEFKDRITMLNDSLKQYRAMEEALQNTLMFAQNTAEEVKKNAQEKADNLINEAKLKAEKLVAEADQKVFETTRKNEELLSQYKIFKTKFDALLDMQKKQMEEML